MQSTEEARIAISLNAVPVSVPNVTVSFPRIVEVTQPISAYSKI